MNNNLYDYKAYCSTSEGRKQTLILFQEFDRLNQVYNKIRSKLVDKALVTADDLAEFLIHVDNFLGGSDDYTVQ